MRTSYILLAAALAVAVVHCSPPPGNDAGQDGGADAITATDAGDARADAPRDTGVDAGPQFRPCARDADCGANATCLLTYPGGLCSRRCTRPADCGAAGLCLEGQCLPRCSVGGGECPPTQACDLFSDNPDDRACFPSCSVPPPAGQPGCATGLTCNPYEGAGICSMNPVPTTGGENGAPCARNEDCRGICQQEVFMGQSTGFIDGYCVSFARLPAADAYQPNQPLPRSNCPAGSVVVPFDNESDEGDVGLCLKGCARDAECRAGYGCIFFEDDMGNRTSTGICDAINCMGPPYAAMPNGGCPTGFACVRNTGAGAMGGHCERRAGPADGGADAAVDAAVDAAPDAPADAPPPG